MLNRSVAPPIAPLAYVPFPQPRLRHLRNGVPVHLGVMGSQDVTSLRLLYRAGHRYTAQPFADELLASLLNKGTRQLNSAQLAEAFERLGANLSTETGYEYLSITLSVLSPQLPQALELLAQVVHEPALESTEFDLLMARTRQGVKQRAERTAYHAQRLFKPNLYGPLHPNGRVLQEAHLSALNLGSLRSLARQHLHAGNLCMLAAGQFDPDALTRHLDRLFGDPAAVLPPATEVSAPEHAPAVGRLHHSLPGRSQSSLLVGQRWPGRQHPHHHSLRMAALVLGGYFGSRLMRRLRETDGFTYGVGCSYSALEDDGLLSISTEVGAQHTQAALDAVAQEARRLVEQGLPDEEWENARSWWQGRWLSRRETPLQWASVMENLLSQNLGPDWDREVYDHVMNARPDDLVAQAAPWLQPEAWLQAVCGPPEAAPAQAA